MTTEVPPQDYVGDISDEEALMRIAQAMKDTAIPVDEKHNVHTFLFNVATAKDTTKIGNLQVDKDINELGTPEHTVRGTKDMLLIASDIMDNEFFAGFFDKASQHTLSTSLSREGFLVRQATVQTKQIADVTKRRKLNKGWFSRKEDVSGGDTTSTNV